MKPTIIRIRRGIGSHRYSACDNNGYFIGNFDTLAEVRRHWAREIRWGQVVLVRELTMEPDMTMVEAAKQAVEQLLRHYAADAANKRGRKGQA